MSHTNSTTNYSFPQFVTTDKPAWLTDINGAFSAADTAIKNASDAAGTAQTNAAQALEDSATALSAANTADGKGSGAVASIASNFSSTDTYAVGALVMYNNLLYICTTAVTSPGAWTGSTNWTRITAAEIADDIKSDISDLDTAIQSKAALANYPDYTKIVTAATNDQTVRYIINYESDSAFGIFVMMLGGALIYISKAGSDPIPSIDILSGTIEASSIDNNKIFLRVGNYKRASFFITSNGSTGLANITVTTI